MVTVLEPQSDCPQCGDPVHVSDTRYGITFYACDRCPTTGAFAYTRTKSGQTLVKTSKVAVESAKRRIRESDHA